MAQLPMDKLMSTLNEIELKPYTAKTITDKGALCKELETIRRRGYSVESGEITNGKACVACPIRDFSGSVIATMSMSVLCETLEESFDLMLKDLTETCQNVSSDLGYNPFI